jgi:hypothetical protein
MTRKAARSGWVAWGLMLLSLALLLVAPLTPATAKPMDCCMDAPCHDIGKATCPDICIVACQIVVPPEQLISEPVGRYAPMASPGPVDMPPGRSVAPDLPPPR